ncbi:hypothetical protein HanRHA438_Chr02g0093391 [Helianthus annuus]|nr:hypothetical protein HanRHA438_Chr02g0093391 [Helianthus annuus]
MTSSGLTFPIPDRALITPTRRSAFSVLENITVSPLTSRLALTNAVHPAVSLCRFRSFSYKCLNSQSWPFISFAFIIM